MALTKPTVTQIEKHPNARKHQAISFLKSGFRLGACFALAYYEIQAAAILFAIAELLGIAEELV
jgi:hypothetical protein